MSAPVDPSATPPETEKTLVGSAAFSVMARVAMQLGRESISSSVTAIIELVKNAYDADADLVKIRFAKTGEPEAMMVVEDNGRGMTLDDLRNHWMVIGTSNKSRNRRSIRRDRVLTGEKGLGRLGLDRLCARTLVQSHAEGTREAVELQIDWQQYERDDARLEEIAHQIYTVPSLRKDPITQQWVEFPHGTRLTMERLKDEWTREAMTELRGELSLLATPFDAVKDFRVTMDSGRAWTDIDGPVEVPDFLLDAAQWKVVATIDDHGRIDLLMSSKHHPVQFHVGPLEWPERFPELGKCPHCGPLRFEFYFFPRKSAELGDQTISKGTIAAFLDRNQGVRIYRDGFRVKPYGEPNGEGDWLRLAFRRMSSPEGVTQDEKPGNWRVGYNQIIGAVFITRDKNSALGDQTNREGLVEGKAFSHLRAFCEDVIKFFELNHQTFELSRLPKQSPVAEAEKKTEESVEATEGALKKLTELTGQLTNLLQPTPMPETPADPESARAAAMHQLAELQVTIANAKTQLEESSRVIRNDRERESREKDTIANLASLGILAAAFGHETLGWASNCAINAGWLERHLPKHFFFADEEIKKKVQQKLTDTCDQAKRIETFAGFSIGNVKPEKRRKTVFSLKEIVVQVFASFGGSLRDQRNIKIEGLDTLPADACKIRGYPIDWESILVNFITNAVWAMKSTPAADRRIVIGLLRIGDNCELTFSDSGIGLAAETEEKIFFPTYSTKRNERGEVFGTGMGLTIVKNFVETNSGGSIRAIAKGPLGGASFVISVPGVFEEEK
jgi:signal transduction histidine kinase